MNKPLKKFSLHLTLIILIFSIISGFNSSQAQEPKPAANFSKPKTSILEAIIRLFKSPENRLITRGTTEVCLISPGKLGKSQVWHTKPQFIWHGKVKESELSVVSLPSNNNYQNPQETIWTKAIPAETQILTYDGAALKPGFTYDGEILTEQDTYLTTFTLLEKSDRDAIAQELSRLENQLRAESVTLEEIAIAKADYFIAQELWSDALQQMYSVRNPSDDLVNALNTIAEHLCN